MNFAQMAAAAQERANTPLNVDGLMVPQNPGDPSFAPSFAAYLRQMLPGITNDQVQGAIQQASWYGNLGSGSNPYMAAYEVASKLGTTTPYDQAAADAARQQAESASPEGYARANDPSEWNRFRDTMETGGTALGNYALPGSAIVTSRLASKGAQDGLSGPGGALALAGTSIAGGAAGNVANYGKIGGGMGDLLGQGWDWVTSWFGGDGGGAVTDAASQISPAEAKAYVDDASDGIEKISRLSEVGSAMGLPGNTPLTDVAKAAGYTGIDSSMGSEFVNAGSGVVNTLKTVKTLGDAAKAFGTAVGGLAGIGKLATGALGAYSGIESLKAQREATQAMKDTADKQIALATDQWNTYRDKYLPLQLESLGNTNAQAKEAAARSQEQWDLWKKNVLPIAGQISTNAQTPIVPDYDRVTREAQQDVNHNAGVQWDNYSRQRQDAQGYSWNPGSANYQAALQKWGNATALGGAVAENNARTQEKYRVEDLNWRRPIEAYGALNGLSSSAGSFGTQAIGAFGDLSNTGSNVPGQVATINNGSMNTYGALAGQAGTNAAQGFYVAGRALDGWNQPTSGYTSPTGSAGVTNNYYGAGSPGTPSSAPTFNYQPNGSSADNYGFADGGHVGTMRKQAIQMQRKEFVRGRYANGGYTRGYADGGAVNMMKLSPQDESTFQSWYQQFAQQLGLNPNPDDPRHFYDYRAAFAHGATPDETGHWPSEFKLEGHPRSYVDPNDTNNASAQPFPGAIDTRRGYADGGPASEAYDARDMATYKHWRATVGGGVARRMPDADTTPIIPDDGGSDMPMMDNADQPHPPRYAIRTLRDDQIDVRAWGAKPRIPRSLQHGYGPGGGIAMANGGAIDGPGTGTSDSISTELPEDAYVIPKDVVTAKGREFFDKMHGPGGPKRYTGALAMQGVPARVSDDEYVVAPEVVKHKGTEFFDKLLEKFHTPVNNAPGNANGGKPRVALPRMVEDALANGAAHSALRRF